MGNISTKLNLAQLVNKVIEVKGKSGMVKGIFIPIEANHLYEGKTGAIYLDLIGFELKDKKGDDTHLIKQSLPKKVRDEMTKDEQNDMPILGNHQLWGSVDDSFKKSDKAKTKAKPTDDEDDDLPF